MGDGSLWTVIASAIPGISLAGMAVWKVYQEWRKEHPHDGIEDRDEREARYVERERERLDRRSDAYIDRIERECDELRFDRDRGWNLARWWENKAHMLWLDLTNARFSLGEFTTPPPLPGLEDPEPKPDGH